ncbi:hypothetical protein FRC05_000280, partial [Tulasnella sp. 425]
DARISKATIKVIVSEANLMDPSEDKSNLTYIPEILSNISAKCSLSTNATLTRVCRTWGDLASDQVWSSLPSLLPLLRILLPLVMVDGALDFDRKARTPNWDRFWALATRVRSLKHNDAQTGDTTEPSTQLTGRISPNVIPFLLLHQSWTSGRFLLPKLETLKWLAKWEHSLLQLCHFLSPSLQSLEIRFAESVPADLATRNLECLASLPSMNVKTLRICTTYTEGDSDVQVATAVASFVKSQPAIVFLDVSDIWSRGEVVRSLIQHANILSLELLLCLETLEELRSLLKLLARQCPRICKLIYTVPSTLPPLTPRHAIEPLLSCSLLMQLQIFHDGISLGSKDIKNMAQAWRRMEVLNLCAGSSTISIFHSSTPLALLLDFAEEFSPRLRRLALNFSCHEELPTADVVWTSFPRLEVLGVGISTVSSTARAIVIGEFLASICSERTKLAYIPEKSWRSNPFETMSWKSSPNASHWAEVAAVLESGQRLQMAALTKALRVKESQKA